MKIVKTKKAEALKPYTLQMRPSVMAKVDAIKEREGVSRQKIIEAVLDQTLSNPKFVLKLEE